MKLDVEPYTSRNDTIDSCKTSPPLRGACTCVFARILDSAFRGALNSMRNTAMREIAR